MTSLEPAICRGTLTHRRFAPLRHGFTYPLFMAWLDIDRIAETMARSRVSSHNRWNWASFDDRDHFGDPREPLRQRLERDAAVNGIDLPRGPIFLLTHLRYLGYVFNPVSFYYCYDEGGELRVMLAEVNNTYGGRQNYWLSNAVAIPSGRTRRYRRTKAMYVSPFMAMEQQYTFVFTDPGRPANSLRQGYGGPPKLPRRRKLRAKAEADRHEDSPAKAGHYDGHHDLIAYMNVIEDGRPLFDATLRLTREPWNAASLRAALLGYPWMTAKVIGAIHWQALRLYMRGVPVVPRPPDATPDVAGGRVLDPIPGATGESR